MLLRARSILRVQPPRLVVGAPAARGQRLPMMPVADLWRFMPPEWTDDKVVYWHFHWRLTTVMTFMLFALYHKPFAGADYKQMWKSPRYKWHINNLKASGEYAENVRLKRTTFYLPEELTSEPEEPTPVSHSIMAPFTLLFQ